MRKILAALVLSLLAFSPAYAADSGGRLWLQSHYAYDGNAQEYFDALASNGCTTPTQAYKSAINAFIVSEKASGAWGTQGYRYIIVTADSCTASINLAQPALFKATITNTCLFSVANGMVGNSTDCRLDPNVTDSAIPNFSQNSAHLLVCIGNSGGSNALGNVGATVRNLIGPVSNKTSRLNTNSSVTDTGGGLAGCHYSDRSSSSALTTGKNGVVQSSGVASTSAAPPGTDITLCEQNGAFCSATMHFYYYEAGGPIADEATHYTNIHTLMVALGAVGAP